ncbi:MAG: glycosyltransferase family 4 protein [Salibacteraceae bacterium]
MKVVLVTDIPNPYRLPLFNELNRQLQSKGAQLKVVFGSARQANRKFELNLQEAQFDYVILDSQRYDLGYEENTVVNYKGLLKVINAERPDRIITIGFTLATMKLWWRSWFRSTPYWIWGGTTEAPASTLRRLQRKLLAQKAQGAIAYGSRAARYFASLGFAPKNIDIAINSTDTTFFAQETERLRQQAEPRSQFRIMYLSYLTERKNPGVVLDVAHRLAQLRSDFVIDMVGDGPLKEALQTQTKQLQIEDRVVFHGFRQKHELPELLAQSDVFLFPTRFDIWGLVLVEAMAAGLPCFASPKAGATEDLIETGETGFITDFEQPEAVAKALHQLLEQPGETKRIGQKASRFIAENVSLPVSASGFLRALGL